MVIHNELNFTNSRILLIDDERDITDLIEEVLKSDGFKEIKKAHSGIEGINLAKEYLPHIIVLDIMLQDIDGIEVCKKIREFSYSPILFLSSKNDEIDKILGLSSGGDDYITKPFSPREISFRIKSQIRRQHYNKSIENTNEIVTIGNLSIDMDGGRVLKEEKKIELTGTEFKILSYLAKNLNRIISKERLYEQICGEYAVGCDNTIMVHIRHLREKIEINPSKPELLLTVKGLGYKLIKE